MRAQMSRKVVRVLPKPGQWKETRRRRRDGPRVNGLRRTRRAAWGATADR